jgi:NAD(P)-dependent dehydrogenase (short-subunit alcohol dehydrogenase family)
MPDAKSWTCLVTGANRGIGLALVRALRDQGHSVIACARGIPASESDPGVRWMPLDVTDDGSIARLAKRLAAEPIDVLINNAGVLPLSATGSKLGSPLAAIGRAEFMSAMDVNAAGPLLISGALLPALRAGHGRLIVNVSSDLASLELAAGTMYAYRASKAALNMITRVMAGELAQDGFTCVAIHPGWVRTDMGGPEADMGVHDSARRIVRTLQTLGTDHNGTYLNYDGEKIPW